jgi:hypothetical protein
MQRQVWNRLEKIGDLLSRRITQIVVVVQDVNESDEEVEDKINRWKSGEVVSGIRGVYKGLELDIIYRQLVSAKRTE